MCLKTSSKHSTVSYIRLDTQLRNTCIKKQDLGNAVASDKTKITTN